MQNREAARYARWAAAAAAAILIAVIVIYAHRRGAANRANSGIARVPASVSQQSKDFSYSRVVNNRTIFTIEASQATEYRDKDRSLLENVAIKIYGKDGTRNDLLRAGACSYVPSTGSIRCQGAVQVSLRSAKSDNSGAADSGLDLETSDILFDRDSGNVSSPNPVTLRFPGGEGKGTGILYNSQEEDVTLQHNVKLEFSGKNVAFASLSADQLEFKAPEKLLILSGGIQADEGGRKFVSERLDVHLDDQMQPRMAVASGNPHWEIGSEGKTQKLTADKMTAIFENGSIARFFATGDARWQASSASEANRLTADRLEIHLAADKSPGSRAEPRELLASGGVKAEWRSAAADRRISTDAMRVILGPYRSNGRDRAQIETAETLAPAKIENKNGRESETIAAGRLLAKFDGSNQLVALQGHSGVQLTRTQAGDAPQSASGKNLDVTFAPGGEWSKMQLDGNAILKQADRVAKAERVDFSRTNEKVVLNGSASISDSQGKISAPRIAISQQTEDVSASGGITATYLGAAQARSPNRKENPLPIHISSDAMSASKSAGAASFIGHARLWQNSNLIQSRVMKFWRADDRAEADGDVVASFPEAPSKVSSRKSSTRAGGPTIWTVHAQQLTYLGANDSKSASVELSGSVHAESANGSISSDSMELHLTQGQNAGPQLTDATAQGHVQIEQNGRAGSAEKGEYLAKEGKFILSGGQPMITDSSGNKIAGRELTFFLASDTILVDSQNGPRTTTKHRVEK